MFMRILNPMRWRPLLVAGLIVSSLLAQEPQQDDENKPGRAVARISLINGDVSVRRGDSNEVLAAAPNSPLVVQDQVLTGPSSRTEIQLDYGNLFRLASQGEVRFAELEYNRYMLQLASGTMTYRVLRDSEAEVEISTPAVAVRPTRRGVYRIAILPDGTTEITVRSGEAEIFTPHGKERIRSGRTMLVRGTTGDAEFQVVAAIPRDEWDQWNEGRDHELERSTSYRYVSPSIYGAEDLDNNGQWVYDAPYGNVWTPNVGPDWAPYRNGRWAWMDFYGWNWVSADPWGWAPYHYGRWYHGTRGWCWWPGAVRSHHYWSPGLVAFVGFGGGGVGVGFGHVGWIPLAPYEAYHPWYGWGAYRGNRNRNYVNNSRIVNNVNITNVYRNARVPNGITAVNSGDFSHGRIHNSVRINDNELRQASLVRGQLPVTPERAALRLSDREASSAPRSSDQNRFFSRRTPTAPDRVSFDDQRRGAEDLSRKTFGGGSGRAGDSPRSVVGDAAGRTIDPGNGRTGGARGDSVSRGAAQTQDSNSGWRRFGEPRGGSAPGTVNSGANTNNVDRNAGARSRDNNSWRRFGEPADGSRTADTNRAPDAGRASRGRQMDSAPSVQPNDNRGLNRDSTGGGRRFESNPGGERRVPESAPARAPRTDAPAREAPRQSSPPAQRKNNMSVSEPLHLSPPIVRERSPQRSNNFRSSDSGVSRSSGFSGGSAARSNGGGGFGGSGGGGNRGTNTAPAPRGNGNSGGGAARSSGGSGSHNSGGGHSGRK